MQDTPLRNPAAFHREHVFLLKLPRQVRNNLQRWAGFPPDSDDMRTPLWPSLVIALVPVVVALLLTLIFQGVAGFCRTFFSQLWLGSTIFVGLWSAEIINRKVLRTLLVDWEEPVRSRSVWSRASQGVRGQRVVGLITAIALIPVEQLLLIDIFPNASFDWPLLALAFVAAALFSSGAYTSTVAAINFILHIREIKLTFYCFDPKCSTVITRVSDIYERATICNAVTLLVLMLPLFFLERTRLVTLMGLLVPLAGAGVLLGTFLLAQVVLSQLIMEEKRRVLAELQQRIEALYSSDAPLDKDRFTEMQNLMSLHDRVSGSSNLALGITATLRYLNSLVIPIVSFVLINRDLLVGLFS